MWLDARVGKQNIEISNYIFLVCVVKGCDEKWRKREREREERKIIYCERFSNRHSIEFIFYDYQMKSWNMSISVWAKVFWKFALGIDSVRFFRLIIPKSDKENKKTNEQIQWFVATIIIYQYAEPIILNRPRIRDARRVFFFLFHSTKYHHQIIFHGYSHFWYDCRELV